MGAQKKPLEGHRRSKRLPLHVRVFVYGRAPGDKPFRDMTETLLVNLHGGLLILGAPVERGQTFLLVNNATQQSRACRAVYIGPECEGRREVGFEFLRPTPNFWKIHFPPDNPQLAAQRAASPAADSASPHT